MFRKVIFLALLFCSVLVFLTQAGYARVPSHIGAVGGGLASGFGDDGGCEGILTVIIVGLLFYLAVYLVILAFQAVAKGIKFLFDKIIKSTL